MELTTDVIETQTDQIINVIVVESDSTRANVSMIDCASGSNSTVSADTAEVDVDNSQSISETNTIDREEDVSVRDNACEIDTSENLRDIILPPRLKKRRRPKSSDLTVVGIPRKRLKLKKNSDHFMK